MWEQVKCATESSVQHGLYETWAWGPTDNVSLCPVCQEKCEDSKIPTLLLYLNLSIYCITKEG